MGVSSVRFMTVQAFFTALHYHYIIGRIVRYSCYYRQSISSIYCVAGTEQS